MRILAAGVLLLLAACSAGPRVRAFAPQKAGAEQAIAILLKQPPNTYGRLQLTVPHETARAATERWQPLAPEITSLRAAGQDWCDSPCLRLPPLEGVMAFDREATEASGVTPVRDFAPTLAGVQEAIAWRDEKPRNVRFVSLRIPFPNYAGTNYEAPTWSWTWRDVRGDVKDFFATEHHVCFYASCQAYADLRGVLFSGGTIGQPTSFVNEQYGVLASTFPGLLMKLKGRTEPSRSIQLETLEPGRSSGWRSVELNTVSVLEETRICGLAAEPPTFNEERCYPFAGIHQIAVRDYNKSAGEVIGDALTTPFRVVGAVGQSMAVGAH